jgi:hypothetical protein
MTSIAAFRDGMRRVSGAPVLLAGVCTITLLVALPLALALQGMLEAHLGASLMAEQAASGADYQWWREFLFQATGLGSTFVPSIIGFGAVLLNLDALLDNKGMAATVLGVTIAWLVIWSFMSGGILDRLARNRRTRAQHFFAAAGVYFWRFLRLGVLAFAIYSFLFAVLHPWLFDDLHDELTAGLTVERTAFLFRLAAYIVFGAIVILCNVTIDYARVRIVVEDRRSAIGALAAGWTFVRRHFKRVLALYLLNALAFVLLIALYALISPGAPGSGVMMWTVLLLGQIYIVGRHYLKLVFYGSETSLFQSSLAHAGYTAAAPFEWPESPAAESISQAAPVAP